MPLESICENTLRGIILMYNQIEHDFELCFEVYIGVIFMRGVYGCICAVYIPSLFIAGIKVRFAPFEIVLFIYELILTF